jgi:hypothetical protein
VGDNDSALTIIATYYNTDATFELDSDGDGIVNDMWTRNWEDFQTGSP